MKPLQSRFNTVLLALTLALAAVVFLAPSGTEKASRSPLTALAADRIEGIRIVPLTGDAITLRKQPDGRWSMREPWQVEANQPRIQALLRIAQSESLADMPIPAGRLSEFGLAPPRSRIWLDEIQIDIGDTDAIDFRRYVRIGDRIHLIQDRFFHYVSGTAAAFVSRALIPGNRRIREIRTESYHLSRARDGSWTLLRPATNASADDLRGLILAWERAQALDVSPLEQPPGNGTIQFRFEGEDTEPLVFWIADRTDKFTLGRVDLGLQYQLTGDQHEKLLGLSAVTRRSLFSEEQDGGSGR